MPRRTTSGYRLYGLRDLNQLRSLRDLRQRFGLELSDVAFAALLIPVAALGHLEMGSVNVALAANLVLGSLQGVFIGSKLCARLPDSWLRPALAGVLFFAGSRLM